jgi:hypothetical protein
LNRSQDLSNFDILLNSNHNVLGFKINRFYLIFFQKFLLDSNAVMALTQQKLAIQFNLMAFGRSQPNGSMPLSLSRRKEGSSLKH